MNLGELVEINETSEIFSNPQHGYTKELLRAIPEPDPIGREDRKRKRLNL
jgi:ABC-type oligopeptide transport system ATPase subunit